jgi:glutamate-1-semialdehyde 2,1-aminomutase
MYGIDLDKTAAELQWELQVFERMHPRSVTCYRQGLEHYLYGTPLH